MGVQTQKLSIYGHSSSGGTINRLALSYVMKTASQKCMMNVSFQDTRKPKWMLPVIFGVIAEELTYLFYLLQLCEDTVWASPEPLTLKNHTIGMISPLSNTLQLIPLT